MKYKKLTPLNHVNENLWLDINKIEAMHFHPKNYERCGYTHIYMKSKIEWEVHETPEQILGASQCTSREEK